MACISGARNNRRCELSSQSFSPPIVALLYDVLDCGLCSLLISRQGRAPASSFLVWMAHFALLLALAAAVSVEPADDIPVLSFEFCSS